VVRGYGFSRWLRMLLSRVWSTCQGRTCICVDPTLDEGAAGTRRAPSCRTHRGLPWVLAVTRVVLSRRGWEERHDGSRTYEVQGERFRGLPCAVLCVWTHPDREQARLERIRCYWLGFVRVPGEW
jgi:hypothetical protein